MLKAVRFRGADDLDGFLGEQMAVEKRDGFKDEFQRVASSFAELYTIRVAEVDNVFEYLEGQFAVVHILLA